MSDLWIFWMHLIWYTLYIMSYFMHVVDLLSHINYSFVVIINIYML